MSTKEQVDEGNSLVSQERICREYATKDGYEVVEVFIEKGESAKTQNRKELQRLLAFCTTKKGNVDAVIAYKVDRISRNLADYSYIRVKLKRFNVEIKSATEFFEDTPAGRFMENIIANVGQFDNDVRTERSVGGMKEAAQEGRYVWMAPVGYSNAKVNSKSTIVQNDLAPLVRKAFEMIVDRTNSSEEIRQILIKEGLVGRKGNPIARSKFFNIIRNPLYKGLIRKFGITSKGTFDPIVSEELFDEVQNILKGKTKKVKYYQHENPDFPLRRFVVNEDGKQLTGYWSKGKRLKYPYYSFQSPGSTVRKEVLEQKFMIFLGRYTFDFQHLNIIKHYLEMHFEKNIKNQHSERHTIENRIEEINHQIDKLIDLQANGGISLDMLTHRTQKFQTEIEYLKDLLKNRKEVMFNISELLAFAAEVLPEPQKLWLKSPFKIRKKLQVFDFPDGLVFDGLNFRTPKICRIFKLKDDFEPTLSQLVPSRYLGKNTVSTHPFQQKNELAGSKEYWDGIVSELLELQQILAPEPITQDDEADLFFR
ncbi:recombinase family protein [Mucilaginibacter sp. BJC16-A38]|nr:recombinase family protein [Mucilaginibacter phenanthrenivorans]